MSSGIEKALPIKKKGDEKSCYLTWEVKMFFFTKMWAEISLFLRVFPVFCAFKLQPFQSSIEKAERSTLWSFNRSSNLGKSHSFPSAVRGSLTIAEKTVIRPEMSGKNSTRFEAKRNGNNKEICKKFGFGTDEFVWKFHEIIPT